MQNSCWKAYIKTKHQKNHIVCIVSKDVVQHFNKNAELWCTDYFQRKLLLQTESCNLSKCTPEVVSLLYSQKAQMSHVLSEISCQMEWCLLHKECHNCMLISKYRWFSACTSWFTKDQEGRKIYWASGNKVLDTFSTIQYDNLLLMPC